MEYFKTNGEDIEFSNYLKNKNHKLFYCSKAICLHLQNDDGFSLAQRYWRYIYYGDGLKTLLNCLIIFLIVFNKFLFFKPSP